MYELVEKMRVRMTDAGLYEEGNEDKQVRKIAGYGHIGDGAFAYLSPLFQQVFNKMRTIAKRAMACL
jgi:hypothetical protein